MSSLEMNKMVAKIGEALANLTAKKVPIIGGAFYHLREYEMSDYRYLIDKAVAFGLNAIQFVPQIHIDNEAGTAVPTVSDTLMTQILAYLDTKPLKKRMLKIHTNTRLTPYTKALPAYFQAVEHYIGIAGRYKIDQIAILNEQRLITGVLDLTGYIARAKKAAKAPIGIALEGWIEDTLITEANANAFDWLGMNIYPSMSRTGPTGNSADGQKAWYQDLSGKEYFKALQTLQAKYSKPLFITETGIQARVGRLANPAQTQPVTPIDEDVQDYFYKATMPVVTRDFDKLIDGVYLWEIMNSPNKYHSTFEPLTRKAGKTIKAYL